MAIKPVVRYMLLCDDWRLDADRKVTIVGLISNIVGIDDPPYPLFYDEMCVFLVLTEGMVKVWRKSPASTRTAAAWLLKLPRERFNLAATRWMSSVCLTAFEIVFFPNLACIRYNSGMRGKWLRSVLCD